MAERSYLGNGHREWYIIQRNGGIFELCMAAFSGNPRWAAFTTRGWMASVVLQLRLARSLQNLRRCTVSDRMHQPSAWMQQGRAVALWSASEASMPWCELWQLWRPCRSVQSFQSCQINASGATGSVRKPGPRRSKCWCWPQADETITIRRIKNRLSESTSSWGWSKTQLSDACFNS